MRISEKLQIPCKQKFLRLTWKNLFVGGETTRQIFMEALENCSLLFFRWLLSSCDLAVVIICLLADVLLRKAILPSNCSSSSIRKKFSTKLEPLAALTSLASKLSLRNGLLLLNTSLELESSLLWLLKLKLSDCEVGECENTFSKMFVGSGFTSCCKVKNGDLLMGWLIVCPACGSSFAQEQCTDGAELLLCWWELLLEILEFPGLWTLWAFFVGEVTKLNLQDSDWLRDWWYCCMPSTIGGEQLLFFMQQPGMLLKFIRKLLLFWSTGSCDIVLVTWLCSGCLLV